jgi:hypothetical protein
MKNNSIHSLPGHRIKKEFIKIHQIINTLQVLTNSIPYDKNLVLTTVKLLQEIKNRVKANQAYCQTIAELNRLNQTPEQ